MEPSFIELRQISKEFKGPAGSFTALNRVDIQIAKGDFTAIVGKSGSGKSTLLNLIAGIDRPTNGDVVVAGTRVDELTESDSAIWRGITLGMVFQFFQLLPTLTAVENIMLPMDFCGTYPYKERLPRAMGLLGLVGLADQAHKLPASLSGGEQQRVALSRALANDPPIILADEPTGNLDSETAAAVLELFNKLTEEGKTVVMVTHERNTIRGLNRKIMLSDGSIIDPGRNI